MSNNGSSPLVLWYNQLGMNDVDRVGGKNASLGEMITKEGANKRGNSSRLTQSFHFFMFEPIFLP
jgi:hypothetical protein